MANFNSWEEDPAAQDENLSRNAQQMSLGNGQPQSQSFRPGATSFTPGAQSFTPGAASFQPGQAYYGNYTPQGYNNSYTQSGYSQPVPQGHNNFYPQGGYNQQHGMYQGYAQPQGQQQSFQQQQQQQQPYPQQQQQPQGAQRQQQPARSIPTIAKRPTDSEKASFDPSTKPTVAKEGGTKVLSIGGDMAQPKAKVLSIGVSAPSGDSKKEQKIKEEKKPETGTTTNPGAGTKSTATKAIEKSVPKEGGSGTPTPTPSSGRTSPSQGGKGEARDVDAIKKEQTADVDDETLKEIYGKEHVNIIFIGHVDAGKSTLGGAILVASNMVDQRTLEKYRTEAKGMGRETWYLSWALDLTKEERAKGKTVEVGRGFFETEKRRYSILDAPGHKNYVPNMIGGASQADVGILVISARKGEYETGFERGGQTREHALLAKTQGVNKLVVAINKMDDPTVEWSQVRYKDCTTKLAQFLKGTGYNLKDDVFFMPIAAQQTLGIKDRIPKDICPWWDGPSLLEYLDAMEALDRKLSAPFMMAVSGKYRELGTVIEGKIEAGVVKKSMSLTMMPNRQQVEVSAVYTETEDEVGIAQCGDQVRLRLRDIEEDDIMPGFVLCSPKRLVHCVSAFEAHIRILDLKSILSAGFNCVLHVHAAIEEVTFAKLLHTLQKGTNRKSKRAPTHAKKGDSIVARIELTGGTGSVCVECYEDYPQMGRFTLRDQGQTIAIGKITKLITDETS